MEVLRGRVEITLLCDMAHPHAGLVVLRTPSQRAPAQPARLALGARRQSTAQGWRRAPVREVHTARRHGGGDGAYVSDGRSDDNQELDQRRQRADDTASR